MVNADEARNIIESILIIICSFFPFFQTLTN